MDNDNLKYCLNLLLENKWILKEDDPDAYRSIREEQKTLRKFCKEKLGANLRLTPQFVMLEKIPDDFEAWMGNSAFTNSDDYTMYCLILAFLEERMSDEQFLLTTLCEEIGYLWGEDAELNWSLYTVRMQFVRAMNYCIEQKLIQQVDGDTNDFRSKETAEVLYEVKQVSRYVLRSYPEDYQQYEHFRDFVSGQENYWQREDHELRRQRVYRKLLYTPGILRHQFPDEFAYIRNYRNSIHDDLQKFTYFQLEVFKSAAAATNREERSKLTLFPDRKGSSDLILQWVTLLWEEIEAATILPDEYGELHLTRLSCEEILESAKERFKSGWSKTHTAKSIGSLMEELLTEMEAWQFCKVEDKINIRFSPMIGRFTGDYTKETKEKIQERMEASNE